jgi:hypothetical protein
MRHANALRLGPRWVILGASLLPFGLVGQLRGEEHWQYNRDIRPILADNCFPCHGPDSASRKASLRLDQRDVAVQAKAIVPGKPDESEVVRRLFTDDVGERMPPRKTKKVLTPEQKEKLRQWIASGAEYQPHWSFIAPVRPPQPVVKNEAWVRNPIDRFILDKLERAGLQPAPEADRRTLARRLSLDLRGLPPTPAEVEAFVNDPAPDAYEKLVDRLLASPHWGEHRGRYWLDAARYADTHGIHIDNYREMYTYRDWVIGAFNRNVPFDVFTVEQLAGDLLPNHSLDQQIASGFNRCNITTNEGGAINEEYLVFYTRDRTETTSKVWLGLTANCAVCHDHKFDPLTQREFYEMAAFFNNTTQGAMDGNIKDTPPVVPVPKPEDRSRWDSLRDELASLDHRMSEHRLAARADFDNWLLEASADNLVALIPDQDLKLHVPLNDGNGNAVRYVADGRPESITLPSDLAWEDGHVDAKTYVSQPAKILEMAEAGDLDKDQAFSFGAWVKPPANNPTGSVFARMEEPLQYRGWDLWLENGRFGSHLIHSWSDDAIKVMSRTPVKKGQWNHLFVTYDGSGKAGGVKIYLNGALQPTETFADSLKGTIRTQVPFKIAQRTSSSRLDHLAIQDLRIYGRALDATEVGQLARASRAAWLLGKPRENRSQEEANELYSWWLLSQDPTYQEMTRQHTALEQEKSAIRGRGTIAHVMQERGEEATAYVLFRGEYDKRRDPVRPSTPHFLPPMPEDSTKDRLGFARWLLRPDHPLTSRVTVNRFWQEVFGTGIVRTSGDFGVSGELPTHPELLDWLAVEFRESGWDVKQFFRLLVTSSTYRQAALTTREKLEADPQNRLLSRGARFRMDGEMLRDYALAASGLLVQKLGGPSVKPYQPDGVWEAVAMIGSDTRDYQRDSGEKLYRRTLYTFWKRSAPPASLDIFNAPTRETCTVRRERTNTPLQALVTLNDPQFVEAARHLAQTTLKESGERFEDRADFLAKRILLRALRPEEEQVVRTSFDELLDFYQSQPEDARKLIAVGESKADPSLDASMLAAWTMIANELLNLDEVLNK